MNAFQAHFIMKHSKTQHGAHRGMNDSKGVRITVKMMCIHQGYSLITQRVWNAKAEGHGVDSLETGKRMSEKL